MNKKIYTFFILSCVTFALFGQRTSGNAQSSTANRVASVTIRAVVADSVDNQLIEFSSVRLFNAKTNQLIQGGTTNQNGLIELKNVKTGNYYLIFSFTGYNSKRVEIKEQQFRRTTLNLGTIKLGEANKKLDEVTVNGKMPELVIKEDTMEYNAAAFKTPDGAVVEDLIKRLPGMEVDADGKITTAAGKQITKVRVNGKDFFGNDPKMATKNLTADMVDKVQVIDKKSDMAILTGVDDDEPETIINLTIKKGMMKGWMGNINAGIGQIIDNKNNEDSRYVASGMLNRFTDTEQYSLIGNTNNINERASTDRGNNVMSGRGGAGGGGGGNSGGGGSTSGGNGITSSSLIGFNMAKEVNKKLKIGANISYNYGDTYTKSNSFRENIFTDSVSYRRSNSTSRSISNNFSIGGKMEYQMDSLTTIIFTPTISFNKSSSSSDSYQKSMAGDADSTAVNESKSSSTLHPKGTNLGLQLDVSRKLSAKGRRLSFSGTLNMSESDGVGTNNSTNKFYLSPDKSTVYNQQNANTANRNSYGMRITYVEPIAKNYFIDLLYNVQFNNTVNERETYDFDPITEEYVDLNANYSRSSSVHSVSQNIRANLRVVQPKYSYNIGVSISPSYTDNVGYIKDWFGQGQDSIYNKPTPRKTVNYAPQFEFTYRFNNDKTLRQFLRMRYNGRTNQPSITQLDPSEDVTNPLNIRSGNPDLLPSFDHNISLEYNSNKRTTQSSFSATLTHKFEQNSIINYTTYERGTGVQYTHPVNENGTWSSQADILFTQPLDKKMRFNLNLRTGAGYSNQVGFTLLNKQSERNVTHTATLSPNLSISYKNNWFYGQFRGQVRYSSSNYTMTGLSPRQSTTYHVSYNTQLTFPWSVSLSSDVTYTANRGYSAGYNQNEVLWNAQLSKSFLRNNAGLIRLQLNDILHQRLNMSRSVTTNSVTDTQYTALTSYYMATFTYRFNNAGNRRGAGNRSRMGGMNDNADPSNPDSFSPANGGGTRGGFRGGNFGGGGGGNRIGR
ncbi:hypothetical protein Palpr_2612 [Paludibacter propionicigenes WB4]|uniref:Outer membrane protein beta-barrel domain-containing protein n=1 Tax=Paludibacter propionicigenes (strain DSM 17365 / JCM 13257 / WB4) TaxID=694427 RepID=E4T7Q0_PALPW|nr:outer membrane beta-barrel protein [Paludibacter propionicigenes]ADQ80744.1 hypothetical protein Palpr_2612 [Paludibacter propionicigenes WB4]